MFELIKAGGLLMWPIMLCSVIAMAIIGERLLSLRQKKIAPKNLVALVWQWQNAGHLDKKRINNLRKSSPLGTILAAGLVNRNHSREIMKESIEETRRHITHDMEHFLSTLGTIASISPLLGLLGTVIGMIKVFTVITSLGVGDPSVLSEGISEALITTAAGLTVAIPSLMFHRFFRGKIDGLIITMEQEALKMVEVMDGIRENEIEAGA